MVPGGTGFDLCGREIPRGESELGETGFVSHDLSNGGVSLVVGSILGPEVRHRLIVVQMPTVFQHRNDKRGDGFGGGVDVLDSGGGVASRERCRGAAAVQVNDFLSIDVGAHLSIFFQMEQMGIEQLADGFVPGRAVAFGGHRGGCFSRVARDVSVSATPREGRCRQGERAARGGSGMDVWMSILDPIRRYSTFFPTL